MDRLRAGQIESEPIKVEPFELSEPLSLTVPVPPAGPAHRLHLWLVDEDDRAVARTYIDAAPIEIPNRNQPQAGRP
jgi:hypothetical protein